MDPLSRQTDSKAKESREIGHESPLSILVIDRARVDEVQTDPVGSHLPPEEPTSRLDQSSQSMKPSDGSSGHRHFGGFREKSNETVVATLRELEVEDCNIFTEIPFCSQ